MPTTMTMTDNPIIIDKSTMNMTNKSTMTTTDNPTTTDNLMTMTDNPIMTMTDNPTMIDESTMTIIDNPIMIYKSTMTIDEDELNIFVHAAKILRIDYLEFLGIVKRYFNIPNYEQERKKVDKYFEIVDKFTKKYTNYSIWW